jgi:hypothetical protein
MTISDIKTVDEETRKLFNKLVDKAHYWNMETIEKDSRSGWRTMDSGREGRTKISCG